MSAWQRWLGWAMPATPQERAAALWSFAYFFALLAGYYVLRPLRDQMGIAGGVRNLPWLFTATFVTLIVAQPLYGALVAKLPRARFVPIVYHFFVANLAVFWLLLTLGVAPVIVARVFFVWVSVFSLFAVAVFWSFMADLFTAEQGKRLFGFIGAGGTAGGLLGPLITIGLSVPLGAVNLLIAAAVLLEVAVFCVHRLERAAAAQAPVSEASSRIAPYRRLGICGSAGAIPFPVSARRRRLGQPALVLRDHHLFRAGEHYLGGHPRPRHANAHLRGHRSDGEYFEPGHPDFHHRASAQAFRYRFCRRRVARRLYRGLCRFVLRSDTWRRDRAAGCAALDELCGRQSGAAGIFHRAWPRRKIQSQKSDRRCDLSRLRRFVWLGVRQPAGAWPKTWRHRARGIAGRGRMACAFGAAGSRPGNARWIDRRRLFSKENQHDHPYDATQLRAGGRCGRLGDNGVAGMGANSGDC